MHTEAEAKTKTCPQAISSGSFLDSCIASACMAWRWGRKPNPDWSPQNMQNYVMPMTRDTRNDPPMYIEDKSHGFCGMAGKPEAS